MTTEEVVTFLDNHPHILESYVLVREIKIFLKFDHPDFHPEIGIKIYRSAVIKGEPYQFSTSHYAHTPLQMSPYLTSRPWSSSEEEAISMALNTITSYVRAALDQGKEPEDNWLVPNQHY